MITALREVIGEKDKTIEELQFSLTPEETPIPIFPQKSLP